MTRVPTTRNFGVDVRLIRVGERTVVAVTVTNTGSEEILALEVATGNETVHFDLDQPIKAGSSRGVHADLVGEYIPLHKYTFNITAVYLKGSLSKIVPDVICGGTVAPPSPPPTSSFTTPIWFWIGKHVGFLAHNVKDTFIYLEGIYLLEEVRKWSANTMITK